MNDPELEEKIKKFVDGLSEDERQILVDYISTNSEYFKDLNGNQSLNYERSK